MDIDWKRVRRLAKWICVKCYQQKGSVVYDWAVFPCDHLICINCFKAKAATLKSEYECGCGQRFNGLSAFEYLKLNSPLMHAAAMELDL